MSVVSRKYAVILKTPIPSGMSLPEMQSWQDGGWYLKFEDCPVPFWAEERPERANMTAEEVREELLNEAEECLIGVRLLSTGMPFYVVHCPTAEMLGCCDERGVIEWMWHASDPLEAARMATWVWLNGFRSVITIKEAARRVRDARANIEKLSQQLGGQQTT